MASAIASQEEEQVQREKLEAETAKAIQNGALDTLQTRAGDAQSEFNEARDRYQKTAAKGGKCLFSQYPTASPTSNRRLTQAPKSFQP
jgi:hypothetical protein